MPKNKCTWALYGPKLNFRYSSDKQSGDPKKKKFENNETHPGPI